ncbi:MAG: hypothetical protein MUF15_15195 [Acidobacteria bacterium]|jgi:hypothetical protein|nr:hypothetical protein [Acidobacteriota bacterium]
MISMKKLFLFLMAAILLTIAAMPVHAGISAYAFGDYYYMFKSNNPNQEKLNGFWLRRLYITYDADISDKIKARARLEMHSDGKFGSSELSITPFVKDVYISYQFLPLHSLTLGIQESLTWSNIEKFYGYRHLEKTPFDLYKNRSSRDFGLALKGSFDNGKKFNYGLMFGNYSSYKEEIDKYKQVSARLTVNPNVNLMLEVSGDYVKRSAVKKSVLLQAFAGYQGDWGRIGLNYGQETIKETGKADVNFGLFSAFAVAKFNKLVEAIVRFDMTADPQINGNDRFLLIDKGYKTNLFIVGLGWNIHPKFQVMPNLKLVSYKENANGVKPKDFSQFNVTFYYQF